MKKKFFILILSVAAMACGISCAALLSACSTESDPVPIDYIYSLQSDGTYAITNASTALTGEITVPTEYNGEKVTAISDGAYEDCTSITVINIPKEIKSIGKMAFYGCTGLKEVNIEYSENYSYYGLESIGAQAFYGCTALTEITIPDSVENVGTALFSGCTALTSLTMPYVYTGSSNIGILFGVEWFDGWYTVNLEDYGRDADFVYYIPNSLKEVTITGGKIYEYSFTGCTSIEHITVPNDITYIGDYAFADCSSLKEITIPDTVSKINSCAFTGCTTLTLIVIPDSVTSIGPNAFTGCTALAEVSLPDTLRRIESGLFAGCTALTTVNIPSSVTYIGDGAFQECTALDNVALPDNQYLQICENAFWGCTALTEITITDAVTSVGNSAFYGCTSLTSVYLGKGLNQIYPYAFYACTALEELYYNVENLTYAGLRAFAGAGTKSGGFTLTIGADVSTFAGSIFSATSYNLVKVVIEEGFTGTIEDGVFEYNTTIEAVVLRNESVPDSIFAACTALKYVELSEKVTTIGSYAFYACTSLTEITIPASVTYISDYAFLGCSSLNYVTFEKTTGWNLYTTDAPENVYEPDLTAPAEAAAYLTRTYFNYIWRYTAE